jgi:lipopolysaccharide transport system ATP-binding protein
MGRIVVSKLGKAYRQYPTRWSRLAEWLLPWQPPRHTAHWVLRDVSFRIDAGEAVGIIGVNGAGKSTLLKLVTGTTLPTTGSVNVAGRLAAMLELGMGFHPDFTGRQNVLMAGQVLGLQEAEVRELMPEIEAFAEIGEYIDEVIRVYSSGMQMRLAFSIATAVRPDILIVDEALSVGDAYFQHKSFDRIRRFKREGTSLLFVSHSMQDVRVLCDRVVLLDQGRVIKDGLADEVADYYNAMIADKENAKLTLEQRRDKQGWLVTKSGTGEAAILKLQLTDANNGKAISTAVVGQKLQLRASVSIGEDIGSLVLGYMLRDRLGHIVWGTNTWHTGQRLTNLRKGQLVEFSLEFSCNLGPGSYSFSPSLVSTDTHLIDNYEWTDNALVFDVINVDRTFFIGSNSLDSRFVVSVLS